ncbi:MAG: Fic family protein [Prevotellaceae bacterium]|jgi:Fic family protein|nr:Fic family protein [Prevotellaceae bacterium]
MYTPTFNISPEILNLVYEIAALLERINIIREKVLSPRLRKENRIKTIHSSLWIEANSLTLQQVTDIVNGKRVVAPEKDIQEVKNAITAYDELLACNPYNADDLLKQHGLLMQNLVKEAGRFRSGDVCVFAGNTPIHVAPPARLVPEHIHNLLEWTKNANLPQIIKSCIFHYEFEFIHPFADGNGRMGRMWQTLLLYQENSVFAWLPVETIVAHRQEEYYRAIRRSTHHNNSGIFTFFMLTALKDAISEFKEEKKEEIEKSDAGVNAGVKFSKTELKIIDLMRKNNTISQTEISKKMKLNESTIYRNIEKLKNLNIITRTVADKNGFWTVNLKE